jgi:DNA-binding response OmpR family regulator
MKKIIIASKLHSFIEKEKSILSRSYFRIFTTNSGKEVLEIHKAEKVDLIIIELDMPGINGDQLCTLVRKNAELRNVSVLIICNNSESDINKCTLCNANAYITRPIKPSLFLEKVLNLLNISKRMSYRVLLEVELKGEHAKKTFLCYSQNISTSGLLFKTNKVLSNDDILTCSFFLPGAMNIITIGKVIRIFKKAADTFEYGIEFINLSNDAKTAIEAFVKKRAEDI